MIHEAITLIAAIGGLFSIASYFRRSATIQQSLTVEPMTAPTLQPLPESSCLGTHNKVLRKNQETGEYDFVSEHCRHEGLNEPLKAALRTPGMRVIYFHGGIEDGQE